MKINQEKNYTINKIKELCKKHNRTMKELIKESNVLELAMVGFIVALLVALLIYGWKLILSMCIIMLPFVILAFIIKRFVK